MSRMMYWLTPGVIFLAGINACPTPDEDVDGDGFTEAEGDCDDADPSINPAAPEQCNGIDDNCDGVADEGLTQSSYWVDLDHDGYGDDAQGGVRACAPPPGTAAVPGDCDDGDASINPGAAEICNGRDDDCDGAADEALPTETFYGDADGDGYGSAAVTVMACGAPGAGYVDNSDDCDDTRAGVNPGAEEICSDGLDNDCDGEGCLLAPVVRLNAADTDFRGIRANDNAGRRVASAGDVNGDGFDDLLVSAHWDDTRGANAGAAYLFYGPVTAGRISLSLADAVFYGEAAGDEAGFTLAGAGDVNGDGFGDVLIGAYLNDAGGTDAGAVYLVHGPVFGAINLGTMANGKLVGEAAGDLAGRSLAGLGDLNGDGFADIAIGASGEHSAFANGGAAYVVYGPISGTVSLASAGAKLKGMGANHYAGISVAAAGDVNGDGVGDLLVGAYGFVANGNKVGAAHLLYGPVTGNRSLSTANARMIGQTTGDYAGWSVSSAGDIDGDGFGDVLVGAPYNDRAATDAGAAYVVRGPVSGVFALANAYGTLLGERAADRFGISVALAGDVDGDGAPDVLVGANREDTGGMDAGAAYLVYGPFSGVVGAGASDTRFIAEAAGDYGGQCVAGVGDLNGDGYSDLMIGAALNDLTAKDAGAAYLIHGVGL